MTDTTTRDAIRAMRAAEPDCTAAEMARALGMTRQAVSKQLRGMDLPTSTARSYEQFVAPPTPDEQRAATARLLGYLPGVGADR